MLSASFLAQANPHQNSVCGEIKRELKQVQFEISRPRTSINDLDVQIANLELEISSNRGRMNDLRDRIQAGELAILRNEEELATLSRQRAPVGNRTQSTADQVEKLELEILKLTKGRDSAVARMRELRGKVDSISRRQYAEYEKIKRTNEAQIRERQRKLDELTNSSEKAAIRSRISKIQASISSSKANLLRLDDDSRKMVKTLRELKAQRDVHISFQNAGLRGLKVKEGELKKYFDSCVTANIEYPVFNRISRLLEQIGGCENYSEYDFNRIVEEVGTDTRNDRILLQAAEEAERKALAANGCQYMPVRHGSGAPSGAHRD